MKAHLVTGGTTPPIIITVATEARECAREKNGKSEPIDIPDTKAALVPWLNEMLFRTFQEGAGDGRREAFAEAAVGMKQSMRPSECPICHRTPGGAEKTAASQVLAGIEDQIHAADGWQLSRILDAAIDRLGQLRTDAAKLGGQS